MLSHVAVQVHLGASINASEVLADWGPRRMVNPECDPGWRLDGLPTAPGPVRDRGVDHGVTGGLFYASVATNFTIRGPGAVNGGARAWNDCHGGATCNGQPNPQQLLRSNMFVFSLCSDVVVEDLKIQDSSAWTLNPQYSNRTSFRRLEITAPALGARVSRGRGLLLTKGIAVIHHVQYGVATMGMGHGRAWTPVLICTLEHARCLSFRRLALSPL